MNVYEEPAESGGAGKTAKHDPVKEFRAMPSAERWLAAVAAAVIIVYLIGGIIRGWALGVFDVCALLGAVGILALVVPHLFGVRLLSPRVRMYAFAVAGVLPAAGFVVEIFWSDVWRALMLAGGVAMGLAAWQIAERERLLR